MQFIKQYNMIRYNIVYISVITSAKQLCNDSCTIKKTLSTLCLKCTVLN